MKIPEIRPMQSRRGTVFGIETDFSDLEPWNVTMAQLREVVQANFIVGMDFPADDPRTFEAALRAPAQVEVEAIGDSAKNAFFSGRVIHFGHLENAVIKTGGIRGGPLYNRGALGMPFRDPWILIHTWEGGTGIYLIQLLEREKPQGGDFEAVELQPMTQSGQRLLMIGDRLLVQTKHAETNKYAAMAIPSAYRYLPAFKKYHVKTPEAEAAGNVLDPLMTGLLMLNTNNVERETVRAHEKLNKARIKSGKLPIPPYDVVKSDLYVTALMRRKRIRGEDQGGTHASPIPHLRMGHDRAYKSGAKTWIRDTLVRVTPEARAEFMRNRQRSHYQAKP